jgi:hypothetical protein
MKSYVEINALLSSQQDNNTQLVYLEGKGKIVKNGMDTSIGQEEGKENKLSALL